MRINLFFYHGSAVHLQRKFNNYYDKAVKNRFTSKAADESEWHIHHSAWHQQVLNVDWINQIKRFLITVSFQEIQEPNM